MEVIFLNTRELKNILEKRKTNLKVEIAEEKAKSVKEPLEIIEKQMRLVELNSIIYIIEYAVAPDLRIEAKSLEEMKIFIIKSLQNNIKKDAISKIKNQDK
jgi:hypothetical protein